jgi:transposase
MITSTVSGSGTSAVLAHFAEQVGAGSDRRIVLVVDGAGWHSAGDVVIPAGIHLVFQPPYSPQVQPSERLWPLIRESLANRDFVDIAEHRKVTAQRCRELSDQPEVVRTRTLMHWWPQDHQPGAGGVASERAAS